MLAESIGFNQVESCYVATAASELAANTLFHGGGGMFEAHVLIPKPGIELISSDNGPGIKDLNLAMREGYSTTGSLGCGLPGALRLMDEMFILTQLGEGTSVCVRKWCK
ncbi:anti-sigma regulatory factor [Candidatus Symbiobacter mobilis CR]|uniref:Anti-sigma regulatory factor n=2 Tax=Candidatus Symbiobacter TaxID=1436289 RepID=U5NAR7_9BURK|nr:anti-sigma regulatory factor [Candidatus Symbiobacter mobilis CR]